MDRLEHLLRHHLSGSQYLDADKIIAGVARRTRRRRTTASIILAAVVLAIVVGAIGTATRFSGHEPPRPPGATMTTPPASPVPSPTNDPSPAPTVSSRPTISGVLADGRYFAELVAVDPDGRVTFDVMQWLSGEAARRAWQEANPQDPDGPPNDYYIVNDNPGLRTMTVSDDIRVELVDMNNVPHGIAVPFAELPVAKAQHHDLFWLTITAGKIAVMEEQYTP
jgi:hypothetical protein